MIEPEEPGNYVVLGDSDRPPIGLADCGVVAFVSFAEV